MLDFPEFSIKEKRKISELLNSEGWEILKDMLKKNIEKKRKDIVNNEYDSSVEFAIQQREIRVLSFFIEEIYDIVADKEGNDIVDTDPSDCYDRKKAL